MIKEIKDSRKALDRFGNLTEGQTFMFQGFLYMKITGLPIINTQSGNHNSIILRPKEKLISAKIGEDELVELCDISITLEPYI